MASTGVAKQQGSTTEQTEEVVRGYFAAVEAGDRNAARDWYAEEATGFFPGEDHEFTKRDVIAYFEMLRAAFPDFQLTPQDIRAQGDRATIEWLITGTFAGPGQMQGFAPNGAAVELRGVDLMRVADGKIVRVDVFNDQMDVARQLGFLPPQGSAMQQRVVKLTNRGTALRAKIGGWTGPEEIADGVWRVQGQPGRCTVLFLRDGDGVTMFDAGGKVMLPHVRSAAAALGGLKRIVLGHGHTDHRGTAPYLGVPVFCHPDEVVDAEGSGGWRYWDNELKFLPQGQRQLHKLFHHRIWDGGPVRISGTVSEGDDVCGFEVEHIPGHAPGLIGLWRERDRLALVSDVFYTLDMLGRDDEPHIPLPGYNFDTDQARASLRKLAALEPAVAWAGHAEPVRDDVGATLSRAADAA